MVREEADRIYSDNALARSSSEPTWTTPPRRSANTAAMSPRSSVTGSMALFGYPRAQENDAKRAARAGLAILRALEDLNVANASRGLPALAARIGLDSGPVVVDSAGEVFGDAPNLAARVQTPPLRERSRRPALAT